MTLYLTLYLTLYYHCAVVVGVGNIDYNITFNLDKVKSNKNKFIFSNGKLKSSLDGFFILRSNNFNFC